MTEDPNGRMGRVVVACMVILAIVTGCAASVSSSSGAHTVTIPDAWQTEISVGALTIDDHAFYGVPWFFGLYPAIRLKLPIEEVVTERKAAYDKLSKVLQMELPVAVRIDLYPDVEAKALGSGTRWTPANTRNDRHKGTRHGDIQV